jgi:tetratricopeptide (TPR) repeat protein
LYREVDHPVGLPFALTSSARFAILDGKKEEAEQYLVESLDIYRKNGNEIGTTISLTGLGNHAFANNDYRLARMYFEEAIEIAREFNSPEREIVGTLFLGTTHLFSGQFNRALHHLEKCARYSEERGLQTFQSTALYFQGYSCLLLGKYDQTIRFAEIALPMAEQTSDLEVVSQLKMLTAAVDLVRGNYRGAYQGFVQAENIKVLSRSGRIIFGEDCGKFGYACSILGMGDTGEAQQLLLEYLQDAVISRRLDKAIYALSGLAKLFFDLGEIARSVNLLRSTTSLPFVRNSRWLNDVVVSPIRNQLTSHHKEWNEPYEHEDIWDLADKITIQLRGESAS